DGPDPLRSRRRTRRTSGRGRRQDGPGRGRRGGAALLSARTPERWTYLRGADHATPSVVEALLALPGVTDVMPSYDSTFVELGPGLGADDVRRAADAAAAAAGDTSAAGGREVALEVAYG